MNEWQNRGKEKKPEETIEKIKAILANMGFDYSCNLISPQMDTCYYAMIQAGGFSSNGKGFTAELCEASGYAELIERIQNKKLSPSLQCFDDYFTYQKKSFPHSSDIRSVHSCIDLLFTKLIKSVSDNDIDLAQAEDIINNLLPKLTTNGEFILRSFYSVKDDKEVLLPIELLQTFTGTNGMAAGNTLDEAIVQGLCEILERYSAIQILTKGLTPPEIPKSELVKYEQAYEVIEKIEANKNYRVSILDASLGKNIPCVICVVKNLKYQTVGVKFGAYPYMGIALERCLSEAFQGQNLESFSRSGSISFAPFARHMWQNILNLLKVSHGYFPASLFLNKPSWEYTEWAMVNNLDNAQMRKMLFGIVECLDSEIFIQDVSFLGFPSVYIYVPQISEIAPIDSLWLEEQAMGRSVQSILTDLKKASRSDVEMLYAFAKLKRNSYLENSFRHIAHVAYDEPFRNVIDEMGFVAFLCAYYLNKDSEAQRILYSLPRTDYINAVRLYVTAESTGMHLDEIRELLTSLCEINIAEQVLSDFKARENVLINILPHCSGKCDMCTNKCVQSKIRQDYFKILECEVKSNIGIEKIRNALLG